MEKLISTNPAKGFEKVGEVPVSSMGEVKEKVRLANSAKLQWKEMGVLKRTELLRGVYEEFAKKKDEIALLITREMGKTIKESENEFDGSLATFRWYLDNAKNYLSDEITYQDKTYLNKVIYEPIGVAAVIVPWNFPFEMFVWGLIPNLMAGNVVVFKHSEECPLMGKLVEEVMNDSDLPKGVFSEVYGDGKVGEMLVNEDIDLVWFTGSSATGKKVYEIAGKKFIKAIMELGGSNPGIIFEDVNLDETIDVMYSKRFFNCGQVCNAVKRLIVHESVFDEVVERIRGMIEKMKVGDPEDRNTDHGSLVSEKQLRTLESQMGDAFEKGAKLVIGGRSPENLKGAYYLPTILTNVTRDMNVWNEEVFGPVLSVVPFKTEEEAIELANDTKYGLGASVFTTDRDRFLRVASRIEAGEIKMNNSKRFYFDPFGGYKLSGKGREHGRTGLHDLCQIKSVSEIKSR